MGHDFHADVESISRIPAAPTILEVICKTTGMGFAAIARVTDERWIACSVRDEIDFGLRPGGELKVETTICHEIQQSGKGVVIDNVAEDACWRGHPTPAMYGFQSYISIPIVLSDGGFFGTLCAIDPRPAQVNRPEIISMFRLFAELIAKHLDLGRQLAHTESKLVEERNIGELREQFIAVLGHDLRTPVRAVRSLSELMLKNAPDERTLTMTRLVRDSAARMQGLIDSLLDLARGKSGGLSLRRDANEPLEPVLRGIVDELNASQPGRAVETDIQLVEPIDCDRSRIGQLLSNLLSNALSYGAADQPVRVEARNDRSSFTLSVANGGIPIPAAALEHLFKPFYRSSVGYREGLGLGLHIASEIAKAHNGMLTVTSDERETRFTFRMPVV